MKTPKKKILIPLIVTITIVSSFFIYKTVENARYKDMRDKNNVKLGDIKIEEKDEKENKVEVTSDKRNNKYKEVSIYPEDLKAELPVNWKGKYDEANQVYYFELNQNILDDKSNNDVNKNTFTVLLALRTTKLFPDNNETAGMNMVKDALVDSTKASITYNPDNIGKPLQLSHLNFGKNYQLADDLSYEIVKDIDFVDDINASNNFKGYGEIFYKRIGKDKAIQIMAFGPSSKEKDISLIGAKFVKSLRAYTDKDSKNDIAKKQALLNIDEKIESKNFNTVTSKKFAVKEQSKEGFYSEISNDPTNPAFGIKITVGSDGREIVLPKGENEKQPRVEKIYYDKPYNKEYLFKYPFRSLFNFGGYLVDSTSLRPKVLDYKNKYVGGKSARKYDVHIEHENAAAADSNLIENPVKLFVYAVRVNEDRIGYITAKYSDSNKDLANKYIEFIANKTVFKR